MSSSEFVNNGNNSCRFTWNKNYPRKKRIFLIFHNSFFLQLILWLAGKVLLKPWLNPVHDGDEDGREVREKIIHMALTNCNLVLSFLLAYFCPSWRCICRWFLSDQQSLTQRRILDWEDSMMKKVTIFIILSLLMIFSFLTIYQFQYQKKYIFDNSNNFKIHF